MTRGIIAGIFAVAFAGPAISQNLPVTGGTSGNPIGMITTQTGTWSVGQESTICTIRIAEALEMRNCDMKLPMTDLFITQDKNGTTLTFKQSKPTATSGTIPMRQSPMCVSTPNGNFTCN